MFRSFVSGVLVLTTVAAASAGTIVVPTQVLTIQAAVNAAQDGDEIVVLAGIYPEAVILSDKADLVLRAKGNVTIDASALNLEGLRVIDCSDVVVKGFKILAAANKPGVRTFADQGNELRACRVVGGGVIGIDIDEGLRMTIRECRIDDGGGIRASGTAIAIVNNKIVRSAQRGIDVAGAAILLQNNTVIEATLDSIRANGLDGIQVRNNVLRDGGGLVLLESAGCLVEGNVIVRATARAIEVADEGAVLVKNTVVEAGAEGIVVLAADVVLRANKVLKAGTSGIFLGANADSCILDANVVKGAANSGIFVDPGSINSLFFKNVAKNNALFDLDDDEPAANLYLANIFEIEKIKG
jgi:hypothetical protein